MAQLTPTEVLAIQAEIAPIKSRRARIFAAMQRLLQTITLDRGYNHEVLEVSLGSFPWEDKTIGQTPAVWIDDYATETVRHAGCVREEKLFILIYGVVREMTLFQFEEFITDLDQCIHENHSLVGQVNKMERTQINTDAQFFSRLDGTRVVQMVVECMYTDKFADRK